MTTDKDPYVDRPGTSDPGPGSDDSAAPGDPAPDRRDARRTQGVADEANEPVENRFPDVEGGEQRESG